LAVQGSNNGKKEKVEREDEELRRNKIPTRGTTPGQKAKKGGKHKGLKKKGEHEKVVRERHLRTRRQFFRNSGKGGSLAAIRSPLETEGGGDQEKKIERGSRRKVGSTLKMLRKATKSTQVKS